MKPRDYRTPPRPSGRPGDGQPEPTGAIAHEKPLVDHHIEEVLAALAAVRTAKAPG